MTAAPPALPPLFICPLSAVFLHDSFAPAFGSLFARSACSRLRRSFCPTRLPLPSAVFLPDLPANLFASYPASAAKRRSATASQQNTAPRRHIFLRIFRKAKRGRLTKKSRSATIKPANFLRKVGRAADCGGLEMRLKSSGQNAPSFLQCKRNFGRFAPQAIDFVLYFVIKYLLSKRSICKSVFYKLSANAVNSTNFSTNCKSSGQNL